MKLGVFCASTTGVLAWAGGVFWVSPAPNMDLKIITMMMTRITIRPKAMIMGVMSAFFLPPRLPLV